MDKSQAEVAADAILAQARANRKLSRRVPRKAPYTSAERRLMSIITVLGLVVGSVASYFFGGTIGWGAAGAVWGVTGGLAVASLTVALRRVLTIRSSGRRTGAAYLKR